MSPCHLYFLANSIITDRQTDRRACGILEHHLSILDLQGDEVMFLVEASVVEEKPAALQGGKAMEAEEHSLVTDLLHYNYDYCFFIYAIVTSPKVI